MQQSTNRLLFIDNLRWVMIMLVISMHAAVTYSGIGGWYHKEKVVPGQGELFTFLTYQTFLQSFFMGLLFFIAGYFVPGAYDKKGFKKFLADRAYRLGLPTLLYVFVLSPLTLFYVSGEWFSGPTGRSFIASYTRYIIRFYFLEGTGPLWFCAALLLFCTIYALVRKWASRSSRIAATVKRFPGDRKIWLFLILIALITFLVRTQFPLGSSFYNMQFPYFTQYIFYFIAGILAYRYSWLDLLAEKTGFRWGRIALIGGLIFWIALLMAGGAFGGNEAYFRSGWHWQSLGLCFLESMAGVGLSLYCITLFKKRFNVQKKIAKFFSQNAFAVYVFHPPILIAISIWMTGWHAAPLVKFIELTFLSIVATYGICALLVRRIPPLKKILS